MENPFLLYSHEFSLFFLLVKQKQTTIMRVCLLGGSGLYYYWPGQLNSVSFQHNIDWVCQTPLALNLYLFTSWGLVFCAGVYFWIKALPNPIWKGQKRDHDTIMYCQDSSDFTRCGRLLSICLLKVLHKGIRGWRVSLEIIRDQNFTILSLMEGFFGAKMQICCRQVRFLSKSTLVQPSNCQINSILFTQLQICIYIIYLMSKWEMTAARKKKNSLTRHEEERPMF